MSYILDALKKADAQRERDPARGIHAQPAVLPVPVPSRDGARTWFWLAGAAAVAVLAWAGWSLYADRPAVMPAQARPEPAAPRLAPAPVVVAAAPASAAPPPAERVATMVLPPAAAPRNEPPSDETDTAQPTRRGRSPLNRPPRSGAVVSAPAAAAARPDSASTARSTAVAPSVPPVASASAAAATPATPAASAAPEAAAIVGNWPPDAPKLAISGGVYSKNPAQRMLIVNGQVFNEGADLGSGVALEEIKPKAAVLRFRGARYSVGF